MSIDARVADVVRHADGSGELVLADRQDANGRVLGRRGPSRLSFASSPSEVFQLVGHDVWGNGRVLVLGDMTIASCRGFTRIEFWGPSTFATALARVTGGGAG